MSLVRFLLVLAIVLLALGFSGSLAHSCLAQSQSEPETSSSADNLSAKKMKTEDTLIITLIPGADMKKVNAILNDADAEVYRTLKVKTQNFSILFVRPKSGSADDMQKKIEAKKDANFKAISRNRKIPRLGQ